VDAKEKAAEKTTEKTTKKIKFTENASYPQTGPDGQLDPKLTVTYAKGSTYEVDNSAGHADRWIRRGVAVEVDAKDGTPKGVIAQPKAVASDPVADAEGTDYESMHVDELHKIASDRNLEGRAGLNKADTIKLIEKDDKAAAKKAAADKAALVAPTVTPAKPK
jgi:hypothetical protein